MNTELLCWKKYVRRTKIQQKKKNKKSKKKAEIEAKKEKKNLEHFIVEEKCTWRNFIKPQWFA